MPDCRQKATKTWALVPVCHTCYDEIMKETLAFYKNKGCSAYSYQKLRPKYMKIFHLVKVARKFDVQDKFKGVTYNKSKKRWQAYLYFSGKNTYIGLFNEKEEAVSAVKKAQMHAREVKAQ